MKKKKISGAEAVIHSLLNEGVDLVWGYPGGAIMPVYDEFYKSVNKVRAPIISTKNFKDSINSFIKVVDEGDIPLRSGKIATTQQEDAMYKWAKQHLKKTPEFHLCKP